MYAMKLTDKSKAKDLKAAGSFRDAGIPLNVQEPFEIYYQWRKHPNLHQFFDIDLSIDIQSSHHIFDHPINVICLHITIIQVWRSGIDVLL